MIPPETPRDIAEFMILDNLEVANSKFFRATPPGPPKDIANLKVWDHLEVANSKFSRATPLNSQGN